MKFPFVMESHTDCCIARAGKNVDGWDIDGWDIDGWDTGGSNIDDQNDWDLDGWDIDCCCVTFLRFLALGIVDASRRVWLECGGSWFDQRRSVLGLAAALGDAVCSQRWPLFVWPFHGLQPRSNALVTMASEVKFLRSINICLCESARVPTSARERTDSFSPLEYIDSLVHLYKPTEPLGLPIPSLQNRILQAPRNGILHALPMG